MSSGTGLPEHQIDGPRFLGETVRCPRDPRRGTGVPESIPLTPEPSFAGVESLMLACQRRDFLRGVARSSLGLAGLGMGLGPIGRQARGDGPEPSLIIRSRSPLDVETPVSAFDQLLTPNRLFFVRSHLGMPAVGLRSPWTIEVGGGVRMPRTFGLDDLAKLEQITIPAVLQCSGNGRALFGTPIPGVAWEKGAVGNAEWTGVRLADVLNLAGVQPGQAPYPVPRRRRPPSPKTPAFHRSLPIARALAASTLLATRMNGEALPALPGGPVRLGRAGVGGEPLDEVAPEGHGRRRRGPRVLPADRIQDPEGPRPARRRPEAGRSRLGHVLECEVVDRLACRGDDPPGRPTRGPRRGLGPAATRPSSRSRSPPGPTRTPGNRPSWSVLRPLTAGDSGDSPGRPRLPAASPFEVEQTAFHRRPSARDDPWNKSGYLWNGIDQVSCEVR